MSLIETAERLFAEKGIDNVSLREINRAAGQKNVAALHYHFGTRESLLEAITVADTGIGIAADDLQRILQPFVQVSHVQERPHEGSGLGLYLVKSIVEMHGGELNVTSEINEGTIVTIRLPYE